jgi:hypothetical protein
MIIEVKVGSVNPCTITALPDPISIPKPPKRPKPYYVPGFESWFVYFLVTLFLHYSMVTLKYYNKVRTYRSKKSATEIEISNPNSI